MKNPRQHETADQQGGPHQRNHPADRKEENTEAQIAEIGLVRKGSRTGLAAPAHRARDTAGQGVELPLFVQDLDDDYRAGERHRDCEVESVPA